MASEAGVLGHWLFISKFTGRVFSTVTLPKGKAALCQVCFEPVSNRHVSLQRGVKVVLLSPNYTHLRGPSRQGSRSPEDNIKLFSNLVNNFDTTQITAAEKQSVPLHIAFNQRAACSYRWEKSLKQSLQETATPPMCTQREHCGEEENFLEQYGFSWSQGNDVFRCFVIFSPTQSFGPWHR